jgi:hypothetical protein
LPSNKASMIPIQPRIKMYAFIMFVDFKLDQPLSPVV